jgi:translation initiation factor 3 subunit C
MFNMSNVQADVPYADVETQGLFNRTLVQVGLCAFRVGLIEESEQTLREIIQTQRVKELLFQGIPTFTSRHSNLHLTPEQEKVERSRQLPFHMHINLDLLECVYLTSSMLIEIPQLAKEEASPELRKQVSSRVFRRMLDISERQAFTGPPENKRDHVIQASKALMGGDWQRCTELITTIKVWNLMPSEAKIKEMLGRKIQEVALRTYLFTSAKFYSNISLDHLATTLALPIAAVTPVVSRMIWEEEISGSLDQSSSMLSLQRVERTALQQQAMDLLERAENMVRLLGHTRPGYGDDSKEGQSGAADGQQGRRGGERRRGAGGYRGRGGRGASQFAGPIRAM